MQDVGQSYVPAQTWPLVAPEKNGTLEALFIMLIISKELLLRSSLRARLRTTGKNGTLMLQDLA